MYAPCLVSCDQPVSNCYYTKPPDIVFCSFISVMFELLMKFKKKKKKIRLTARHITARQNVRVTYCADAIRPRWAAICAVVFYLICGVVAALSEIKFSTSVCSPAGNSEFSSGTKPARPESDQGPESQFVVFFLTQLAVSVVSSGVCSIFVSQMEYPGGGGAVLSSGNVPAFLTKLWTLVEDPDTHPLICWSPVRTLIANS